MNVTRIPFDVSLEKAITLTTGGLTCLYEKGNLRYIKKDGEELVRMIYTAVRDGDWNTAAYTILKENIINDETGFRISYIAKYALNGIDYSAAITITGTNDEQIIFSMKGIAESDFNTNRTGICVLLPVKECAGKQVYITEPANIETVTRFPTFIAPAQPFGNIKKMQWVAGRHEITMFYEGDVFESEDQRNWMDDSFKIYSRPLALPFPYTIKKGEEIRQQVTVRVSQEKQPLQHKKDTKSEKEKKYAVPAFGIDNGNRHLTSSDYERLQLLYCDKIRLELFFSDDWKAFLQNDFEIAERLGKTVELVAFFTNDFNNELIDIANFLPSMGKVVVSILLLHQEHKVTPPFLQQAAWLVLKERNPSLKIGYGTDVYFTELNRNRPLNDLYDFVSFSINPQIHSFDNRSLIENISSVESIMQTVRTFTSKPVHVSPITFKKRKNHDTTGRERNMPVNNFDERLHTGFAVGWFLLCLYALRDADSVTFFSLGGAAKIEPGSPLENVLQQLNDFKPMAYYKKPGNNTTIVFENERSETLVFELDQAFTTITTS